MILLDIKSVKCIQLQHSMKGEIIKLSEKRSYSNFCKEKLVLLTKLRDQSIVPITDSSLDFRHLYQTTDAPKRIAP